jgi:hypothetical protein
MTPTEAAAAATRANRAPLTLLPVPLSRRRAFMGLLLGLASTDDVLCDSFGTPPVPDDKELSFTRIVINPTCPVDVIATKADRVGSQTNKPDLQMETGFVVAQRSSVKYTRQWRALRWLPQVSVSYQSWCAQPVRQDRRLG